MLGLDPDPRISDGELDAQLAGFPGADLSGHRNAACLGELQRVAHQIDQHLLKPQGIADDDAVDG